MFTEQIKNGLKFIYGVKCSSDKFVYQLMKRIRRCYTVVLFNASSAIRNLGKFVIFSFFFQRSQNH